MAHDPADRYVWAAAGEFQLFQSFHFYGFPDLCFFGPQSTVHSPSPRLTLPSSFASLNRQLDVAVQRQLAGENIPVECQ